MSDFQKAGSVREFPVGTMKTVVVGKKPVAIAKVDGQYFAVDDICSHEQCSLGTEGFLDDNLITCGCHGSQFDITTGKVLSLPAPSDVTSYEVKVEGDEIFVKI